MTYIVMVRSESMPASCWGVYSKVALVEVGEGFDADHQPVGISSRYRGVVRIIEERRRLHAHGDKSAAARAVRELQAEADRLNEADRRFGQPHFDHGQT